MAGTRGRRLYTVVGIKRLKCIRCPRKAQVQYFACADGNQRPVCVPCGDAVKLRTLMFLGVSSRRKLSYTSRGLRRISCIRGCNAVARHQWQLDGKFYPLCNTCDLALNNLVIIYMKIPNARQLISHYEKRIKNHGWH